jgi:hypothetical protein
MEFPVKVVGEVMPIREIWSGDYRLAGVPAESSANHHGGMAGPEPFSDFVQVALDVGWDIDLGQCAHGSAPNLMAPVTAAAMRAAQRSFRSAMVRSVAERTVGLPSFFPSPSSLVTILALFKKSF